MDQIAPFFKFSQGNMTSNPPNNAARHPTREMYFNTSHSRKLPPPHVSTWSWIYAQAYRFDEINISN